MVERPPSALPGETIAGELAGSSLDGIAQIDIVGPAALIAHRRSVDIQGSARPTLTYPMCLHQMSHRFALGVGRHHFFEFTSRSMALSIICSASSFFSFAFSASSDFSRLASDTSMPPNFERHLMGWMSLPQTATLWV